MTRQCQCGYPATPCDKTKHDYGHECVYGNELARRLDDERHRRRVLLLMQEQAKTDRLQKQMFIMAIVAGALTVLIILGLML
jgi:hypothetical protein